MEPLSFFSYLDRSLTPYHAAAESRLILAEAGFAPLSADTSRWQLEVGGRYVVATDDGTTLAFALPRALPARLRIIGCHNDSPALRLKPNPVIEREGLALLNLEVYGGPLLGTWFDRPLAIAGRVFAAGRDWAHPEDILVTLPQTVTIPSLAIHMKREPGDINPQKELLPIWDHADGADFATAVAEAAGVAGTDVLASELYLASREPAQTLGAGDLYASSRIDNLANAYAATCALAAGAADDVLAIAVSYQNEEIGSHSRGGAASLRLAQVIGAIAEQLGTSAAALCADALILSCDQAHAAHPNYPEKADPVLRPRLGAGPVLKLAANHSYATTARGEAIFRALCTAHNLPYQVFANRADMRGGSTIGPIAEVATGIEAIDVGNAMLAMHSIRELASLDDQAAMQRLMQAFLQS
ncbi:MAG: M18 family aminopeptidase [Peptococcaceae bacterium]|nr:M18 family aminopeptidase [Peptococcaceae bacterium]